MRKSKASFLSKDQTTNITVLALEQLENENLYSISDQVIQSQHNSSSKNSLSFLLRIS